MCSLVVPYLASLFFTEMRKLATKLCVKFFTVAAVTNIRCVVVAIRAIMFNNTAVHVFWAPSEKGENELRLKTNYFTQKWVKIEDHDVQFVSNPFKI